MKRTVDSLKNTLFDVVIIGAGIHGAATAWACAGRGLKTALVDQDDFGGAASANSLKIIHGGLRYLQHLNIKRMRESIHSRQIITKLSPHNIRVISCFVPNSGFGLQSNLVMGLGLKLNDCIAFDRNRGIDRNCLIPSSKILSLSRCRELFPDIDWRGMRGGSLWYEAIAFNSERLTLDFIKDAVKNGATVANYIKIQKLLTDGSGRIMGCSAVDSLCQESFTIKARSVVVSGGAWNQYLCAAVPKTEHHAKRYAKAVNIIVAKPLFPDHAVGLTGETGYQDRDAVLKKKGRFFFFVPWRGYTMIGTTYTRFDDSPDELKAETDDIAEILREINDIYPPAGLSMADVTYVHVGLVPRSAHDNEQEPDVQLEKETNVITAEDQTGIPEGAFFVKSVKFTTAPVVACNTADRLARYLEQPKRPAAPSGSSLPSSEPLQSIPSEFAYLSSRYGKECSDILPYVSKNPEQISIHPPLSLGELEYFLQHEMAMKLGDVVFRRSELATAQCPEDTVLQAIATHMGRHFGWPQERIETEIQDVKDHFHWR